MKQVCQTILSCGAIYCPQYITHATMYSICLIKQTPTRMATCTCFSHCHAGAYSLTLLLCDERSYNIYTLLLLSICIKLTHPKEMCKEYLFKKIPVYALHTCYEKKCWNYIMALERHVHKQYSTADIKSPTLLHRLNWLLLKFSPRGRVLCLLKENQLFNIQNTHLTETFKLSTVYHIKLHCARG